MTHLVVIGGGITGLAAAWEATQSHSPAPRVTVLEAAPGLGGLIRTSEFLGMPIDEAADAFLARVPEAVELCRELGLDDQFTHPAATSAMVWNGSQFRWFPKKSVLGVPLDLAALEETALLSRGGMARVAAEAGRRVEYPASAGDKSAGAFLRSTFGDELVDRVVGPLVGGIAAGDVDRMSLRAVLPQIADAAEAADGSLTDELRRRATNADPEAPVFNALLGGTQTLTDALVRELRSCGVDIRTSSAVTSLTRSGDEIAVGGDWGSLDADAVVLTTPAVQSAKVLESIAADPARLIGSIHTASVAMLTLAYPLGTVEIDSNASGFLIPRGSGMTLTAVSVGNAKWPHWSDGEHSILRASVGHVGDDTSARLAEPDLLGAVRRDLTTTIGLDAAPVAHRVSRWLGGFHQYDVGHLDLCDEIDSGLAGLTEGRVRVAGAAYRGLGIPACIRQGRQAVSLLLSP